MRVLIVQGAQGFAKKIEINLLTPHKSLKFGDPGLRLNPIHVRDAARAHLLAATKGKKGERYIASAHNLTNADLVAAIEARGWSVWWDPAMAPGQEFDRQISAELKTTATVLVVWTPDSVGSRWVRGEAREGADRGILVPVRFDGAAGQIDHAKLNVDGGAISLGHPVGCSGNRIVLHLVNAMKRLGTRRGIATECIGGGQGGAMLIEMV